MLGGRFALITLLGVFSVLLQVRGECRNHRVDSTPSNVYRDLRCTPKYAADQEDCIEEYDCSHIFNRPENTCHFKGKSYKLREEIDSEDLSDILRDNCKCSEGLEFICPLRMDGCAEDWVGGYPAPGCYLRHELNRACANGQICPPFDDNVKCKVGDATHDEGNQFRHPTKKCVDCVCEKGFDGKLEAPSCQPINCTYTQLTNAKEIVNNCAPLYKDDQCCPATWVCPTDSTVYHPNPLPSTADNLNLHCKFGEKTMKVGEYAIYTSEEYGEATCECSLPPFLYCQVFEKQERPMDSTN